MSYTEYDLAKRLRGRSPTRAVELAEVLAVEPLKIKIGNGEYEQGPDKWTFYEPWFEDRDAEIKNMEHESGQHTGASVNCSGGYGISQMSYSKETVARGRYEERKAFMKYNVGDLLAVQQMAGDNQFMILCKVREVV